MRFIIDEIKELTRNYDLLKYLFLSDFKVLYKNKLLGFLWAILDPLFMMLVYIFLVVIVFKRGDAQYPVLLFSALLPWRWFLLSTANSTKILISNAQLIQTVKISTIIFPMNQVFKGFVNFCMGLVVLIPMLFIFDTNINANILWFFPVVIIQFLFITGVALIVSYIGIYFRDLENILQFVLKIGFYLSPALYSLELIPAKFLKLYLIINPFASLLSTYKNIFVRGLPPNDMFYVFVIYAIVFLVFGLYIFNKKQKNIAKDI